MKAIYTNSDGQQFTVTVLSYNADKLLIRGKFEDTGSVHNFRFNDITMVTAGEVDYTLTDGGFNDEMGCFTMLVKRQLPDDACPIETEVPLYDVMDFISDSCVYLGISRHNW